MSRSVSAPSSVTKTSPCWNGLIVPGSTLMYGSNFWIVTERPRETRSRPSDAAAMPLPSAETTPPVMKMKRVSGREEVGIKLWETECTHGPGGRSRRRRQQLLRVPSGGAVAALRPEHPHELGHNAVAA